ncbi:hypothetical protein Bbelb_388700 [Branchiostoma belcheri]|nr:hypothetical protein Bbelb_388700 [Branchiostoma belcheri]
MSNLHQRDNNFGVASWIERSALKHGDSGVASWIERSALKHGDSEVRQLIPPAQLLPRTTAVESRRYHITYHTGVSYEFTAPPESTTKMPQVTMLLWDLD